MTDEEVLVVPRTAVPGGTDFLGLRTTGLDSFIDAAQAVARFEPRATMEHDPDYKQLIPYVVVRDGRRWFLMRRTDAGGDPRLHGRYSIGVGGHINPGDGDLRGGLSREWREELICEIEPEMRLVALLNDDTTDVGAVHLGLVFVADADGRHVAIRETDKLEGWFADEEEVAGVRESMESWSRLAFDALRVSG